MLFYISSNLRHRATSIITSAFTEDITGNTVTRIELWKGALLIFKESPLIGVGTGNFEKNIIRLVDEKKLKLPPTLVHAHNIYFQALATRGAVGVIISLCFFIALIKWGVERIKLNGGTGGT